MSDSEIMYSVIIPVFNEERNIEPLYRRVKKVMDGLRGPYEIVFIDDGSSDGSFSILKRLAFSDKAVCVVRFSGNFGQHNAVVAGIREAKGGIMITLDSDLQNPPEEIPNLLDKMRDGFDMVSGYRKARKDSATRRLGSLAINRLIAALTGLRMKDYGSMLRVFKSGVGRSVADIFERNHGYITMLFTRVTRKIAELEVGHEERYDGVSKYTFKKLATTFLRIFCYNDSVARFFIRAKGPLYEVEEKIRDGI